MQSQKIVKEARARARKEVRRRKIAESSAVKDDDKREVGKKRAKGRRSTTVSAAGAISINGD